MRRLSGFSGIVAGLFVACAGMGLVRQAGAAEAPKFELPKALELDARGQWETIRQQLEKRAILKPLFEQALDPASTLLESDRDPLDVTLRRVRALMDDIAKTAPLAIPAQIREQLDALANEVGNIAPDAKDRRYDIYRKLCSVRRAIALANPIAKMDRMVLVMRHEGPGHIVDQFFGYRQGTGGGLVEISAPMSDAPVVRDLLESAKVESGSYAGQAIVRRGAYLSPSVSYDGRTIYFAWCEVAGPLDEQAKQIWNRVEVNFNDEPAYNPEADRLVKWNPRNTFHLFSVNVDGTGLRQLTDGAFNDIDPCEMPDGRLVFVSERRGGFGRCHGRYCPTYTLHVCRPDGSGIEAISYHESNEWKPTINHDGMVIFQRWDYWDRGNLEAHHPWITTPDGYDARALQGNYPNSLRDRPNAEADLRAIPNSHKYVGTAAAHHGTATGALIVIDPRAADDQKMNAVRRLTPEVPFPEVEEARDGGPREMYATPWPLSEKYYLAAYRPDGRQRGIYLVDAFGNKELIYVGDIPAFSPMPLAASPKPPVVPSQASPQNIRPPQQVTASGKSIEMGPVRIANVYDSDKPLPAGTRVKWLRVMQVIPKSFPLHNNPRIGYGIDKGARAVLGTVPVEEDGSVHFLAPVNVPLFFQLLDEQGLAVQSMRSDTWVNRGQHLTCLGCHEPRQRAQAAPPRYPTALQREPSSIVADVEGSKPFSYPRLVQPVLDRNCVDCHKKNADKKAPDLSAGDFEANRFKWFTSYANLRPYAFFYGWPHQPDRNEYDVWSTARTEPGRFGARASKLYNMLSKGHHDVKLSPEDLHRIALWLDSNSDFFGAYQDPAGQARGQVVRPDLE